MKEKENEQLENVYLAESVEAQVKYRKPVFLEAGKIEKLTHGSRVKYSDEPDSGHHGD